MERRDEELGWIRRSREGDLAAFEELIRRYQQMIHALTYRMTGSTSDAEDLAQEVFIQAYRKLGSFRGDSQFSTWLYRIGINTCLNWKKSQQRRAQLHQEWAQQPPETADRNDEVGSRVQEALLALPIIPCAVNPRYRSSATCTMSPGCTSVSARRISRQGFGGGTGIRITTGRRDGIAGTRRPTTGGGAHRTGIEKQRQNP